MKALHITFRYGNDICGGAELFFRNLSEELSQRGVTVDICTTRTTTLTPFIKSATLFDNNLKDETINGIEVKRFPVINPNPYISLIFEKLLQRRFDREESESSLEIRNLLTQSLQGNGGILADGWNHPENYGAGSFRWTKKDAAVIIHDSDVTSIFFTISNPRKIPFDLELTSPGRHEHRRIQSEPWGGRILFSLDHCTGPVAVRIMTEKVWHPLKDFRSLGVAVSQIGYETSRYTKDVDMDHDYRSALIPGKKNIPLFMRHAQKRPKIYSRIFNYLRGPSSPAMISWLKENISRYDIVMAQMFPFNTIEYSLIARKFNKPLILLPLMHVDDEFYHWNHYYDMLKQADCVFALTSYSKDSVFDVLGTKSMKIGAGINRKIFFDPSVSGKRFRERYGTENKKIILTVSRKSPAKHYEYLIQAVEDIARFDPEVMLVMIGPDDDKVPITSQQVQYLGKIDERDLADAYDACDIFAMMSESESFGMVFCEAWSRKKPVIGNKNCGAVSSVIEDGSDGLLCSDKATLREALMILLNDENRRKQMGEHGFRKVMANYTWDGIAEKVVKCYQEIIGRYPDGRS